MTKNIYQRINEIQKAVDYIKKDRSVNGGGQNYTAVSHDGLISVIRKHLVENGVVIYPEQQTSVMLVQRDKEKGIAMHLYEATYHINFVNIDDPKDRIVVQIAAHAADNGDKAPGKAVTYATKSALLKVFSLETGDDDESRTAEDDPDAYMAEEILAITGAETMESLSTEFRKLFAKYNAMKDKKAIAFLTAEKDKKKKQLSEIEQ